MNIEILQIGNLKEIKLFSYAYPKFSVSHGVSAVKFSEILLDF